MIVLAGIALVLPSQSKDMLAALADGGLVPREVFAFYLSLALLTFSGWYWVAGTTKQIRKATSDPLAVLGNNDGRRRPHELLKMP